MKFNSYDTAMFINQITNESMAPPGAETFQILIPLATLRTAEREHLMNFRLQVSSSTATVEPRGAVVNPLYDATFGTRDSDDAPIMEFFVLDPLEDTISPLATDIRNDFRAEDTECLIIRIFPMDVDGRRELFMCNNDVWSPAVPQLMVCCWNKPRIP